MPVRCRRIDPRPVRIEALGELRAGVAPAIEIRRRGHFAIVVNQAAALVIFHRDGDVAASVGEIRTGKTTDAPVRRMSIAISRRIAPEAALLCPAILAVEIDPLVIVLQDYVDRTGDRVRTVDRRTADRERLDAVDQLGVDLPEVDLLARVGRAEDARGVRADEPAAVDQHQRALAAEAEEVDERLAAAERTALGGADRRASGDAELRQFVQRICRVDESALLDRRRIEDRRGLDRVEVRLGDARAGNDDAACGGSPGRCGRVLALGLEAGGARRRIRQRRTVDGTFCRCACSCCACVCAAEAELAQAALMATTEVVKLKREMG